MQPQPDAQQDHWEWLDSPVWTRGELQTCMHGLLTDAYHNDTTRRDAWRDILEWLNSSVWPHRQFATVC